MKTAEVSPMNVPSIVLPLLIEGIIFLLPNNLPPKYAKISIVLTKITAYKNMYSPFRLFKIPIREKKPDLNIKKLNKEENKNLKFKKKIPARKLAEIFSRERLETGRIYSMNIDSANEHGSWDVPCYMSNLCQEIIHPTVPIKEDRKSVV